MSNKATHVYADLTPPFALDERAACTVTPTGEEYLRAEEQEARQAWIIAIASIPAKWGQRRTNAINKALRLRERYEQLIGHPAGHPPADD